MTLANKDNLLHTGFSWPEVLELERQVTPLAVLQTADPVPSNDNTQGYGAGSIWINTANNREWTCVSAATGAAIWSFSGAVPGFAEPSGIVTQFGSGTGSFAEEGNLYRLVQNAVPVGATASDVVVAAFTLPASSFDQSGRGIQITVAGGCPNANAKTLKIIFNPASAVVGSTVGGGGTTIASIAGSTSSGGFQLMAQVFKFGASGSNTQMAIHSSAQIGATVTALLQPTSLTATESGAIAIAVTANVANVGDVTTSWAEINAMN
jgi:hypothetical protein